MFTLVSYFPHLMVALFFVSVAVWSFPDKRRFLILSISAALIAVLIAHLNRVFNLYPPDPYFPSGHMTLSLCVAFSLGLLRPWTLAISLPILLLFGIELVTQRFHSTLDVLAAVPLVLSVYACIFGVARWRGVRPLDSRPRSL